MTTDIKTKLQECAAAVGEMTATNSVSIGVSASHTTSGLAGWIALGLGLGACLLVAVVATHLQKDKN